MIDKTTTQTRIFHTKDIKIKISIKKAMPYMTTEPQRGVACVYNLFITTFAQL